LHLLFADVVNEISLHPRPASLSLAGNVETDHPQEESDKHVTSHAIELRNGSRSNRARAYFQRK